MPNPLIYASTTPDHSLHKGGVAVGVNSVEYNPSNGWVNGAIPTDWDYVIYKTTSGANPNIFAPVNEQEFYRFVLMQGGSASDTTSIGAALAWIATQSDLLAFHTSLPNIITDGLVLALNAGDVSSYPTQGTTWYDVCGQGNNGTLNNGPTFNSGNYIEFDGTDDYSSVTGVGITDYSQPFSMGIVFQVDSGATWSNGYRSNIFSIAGSYAGMYGLFKHSTSELGVQLRDSNSTIYASCSGNVVGVWYYLVSTWDGSILKLYLNGALVSTQTAGGITGTPDTTNLHIGGGRAFGGAYGNVFEGDIAKCEYYDKTLTADEVVANLANAGLNMFSNCKTAKDIIDNFPDLVGYDGYYYVYPEGPGTTPYKVYCDMTTDGGGWMLVTRSHPSTVNLNGENWGWGGGAIGDIDDHTQAYQLGWGDIWDGQATFTEYIYGNQNTNYDDSWGPFIYKVSNINYTNLFGLDTQQSYTRSTLKSDTSVYGTTSYPGMQNAIGFITTATSGNRYYMRDCCGYSNYGAFPTQMTTTYCGANFYYSGPWCGGSTTTGGVYDNNSYVANGLTYGGTNQYMIMVR